MSQDDSAEKQRKYFEDQLANAKAIAELGNVGGGIAKVAMEGLVGRLSQEEIQAQINEVTAAYAKAKEADERAQSEVRARLDAIERMLTDLTRKLDK